MSESIPSFIKPSEDYDDLFKDDDLLMLGSTVAATPISQAPPLTSGKDISSSSDRKRSARTSGGQVSTPETRSSKRIKTSQTTVPSQEAQQFHRLSGGQIPLDVIAGWSRLRTPDAARSMLYSSGESFFHQLRLGNQLAAATRGDMRLRDEMKKVQVDLQAAEGEKRRMGEANKQLKDEVAVLAKEKDKLSRAVSTLDKEKEELVASQGIKARELSLQVEALQGAVSKYKEALPERYKLGFAKGVRDYLKSTWKVMPDLDWALMGADVVAQIEAFQAEATAEVLKSSTPQSKKALRQPDAPSSKAGEHTSNPGAKTVAPANAVENAPGDDTGKVELVEDRSSPTATDGIQAP